MNTTKKDMLIYLSVTNDVIADQRVHRIASTLAEEGYSVHVVGRFLKDNHDFVHRPYRVTLLRLPFRKGFLFYACYNVYLFVFLLFRQKGILIANDLDTLIPNFLIARLKSVPILFDSHEYFTEVPELAHRKWVKKVWQTIEKIFVPRVPYCYTVCESIATIYSKQYGNKFEVIRNLPFRKEPVQVSPLNIEQQNIIYQGALNVGRGIEKVIDAMAFLPDVHFYIAGSGDIEINLRQQAKQSPANQRIHFLGRIPLEQLHAYTCGAHLGISLEEPISLNYYYALPNKLFDYIQANIPVLVSDFPEMKNIVDTYEVGITTNEKEPEHLAALIREMLNNKEKRKIWAQNLKYAASVLCWENEKRKLLTLILRSIDQSR